MAGLRELDLDSVREAIATLREEGYRIREVGSITQTDSGVTFEVELYANTRSKSLNPAIRQPLREMATTFQKAVSAVFGRGEGPAVVVTLYEGEDADAWAEKARNDSSVSRVEVVEDDAVDDEETVEDDEEPAEDSQDSDDEEPVETPEEAAEDSLLDGGERVGTKRTDRGQDDEEENVGE